MANGGLDETIRAVPELKSAVFDNFIMLKVYKGAGKSNSEFFSAMPTFRSVPHFFVTDAYGKIIATQNTEGFETGKGESDYDVAKLILFFNTWKNKD